MSKQIRVVVVLILVFLLEVCTVNASKFNMSYLYGNYNYMNLINRTNNSLNEVSPSYFDLNDDGSLCLNKVDTAFVKSAHASGVKVVPFLSNHWDREKGRNALFNVDKLSTQIVDVVNKYGFDGVNVDIENLTEKDRDKYTNLVKVLRRKLGNDKSLSVAVAPNPYNWSNGWQGSYDYSLLANYADYLMIMAYDEHYESGSAGPVAGIEFVEASIRYALKYVSKDKIVLGIPFYGRYWKSESTYGGYGISLNKIDGLLNSYKSSVTYDKQSESVKAIIKVSEYDKKPTINGRTLYAGTYTIWYENEESLKAKLALVNKYDLKGTGSWSLGQENEEVWTYYANTLNNNDDDINTSFIDVENNRWSYDYIKTVKEKKLMVGKTANLFAPKDNITRAEFATTIARALNLEIKSYEIATYVDTKNHWAKNYIEAMRKEGLMVGSGNGLFRPDDSITREEVAKVLSMLKLNKNKVNGGYYFKDISNKSWSYNYIIDVVQKGYMTGYPDDTFRPENLMTREEMAVVVCRAFN